MEIQLPKWVVCEVNKDSNKSIQYTIKQILIEYLDSEEGKKIRERIREREGVLN